MHDSDHQRWMGLMATTTGLSFLVQLGVQIALIVLVATVVRRHRPDAYKTLLGWAVASLTASTLGRIAGAIAPVLFAREGGVEAIYKQQVVFGLVWIPVTIGLFVWLARGLVKLAQPPVTPKVEGSPPYR